MDISKRLRIARNTSRKTQTEVSQSLNISNKTLSGYERAVSQPDLDTLNKLARVYNTSVDFLLGNTDKINDNTNTLYRRIKVYGEVPAGIPIEAIEDVRDYEDISLQEFNVNKQYIGLKVKGDSMYPKYLEGDTVIVELTPQCESGQDAVVYINGYNATLKKVIKNSDNSITLQPLNPNYPPKTYGKNDEIITILGIVKQIRRDI